MAGTPIVFPRGREVVLGVSAGIAAYKSCELLRRLQDNGFLVTVIPTEASLNFLGKATWQALSGREVFTSVWEDSASVSHISVADKADLIVIAPATADVIARIASGRADDLLTTTVLATAAPILIVPAMHPNMWLNSATVANVEILRSRGITVMEPEIGRLTGRDSGIGRFPETAAIVSQVMEIADISGSLAKRRILVTAGGTREAIDPVRFIGNHSSGRQGLAVAYEALREGAEVTIVVGSTDPFELPGAEIIAVNSAAEMKDAVLANFSTCDALVMSAAVADARPAITGEEKIKKQDLQTIELVQNPDILQLVGGKKKANQVVVGFAAETTTDYLKLAQEKMRRKSADLLYVNNVSNGGIFGSDRTSGKLLNVTGEIESFSNSTKHEVAKAIVKNIAEKLEKVSG